MVVTVFGDPVVAAIGVLRAALAARGETYAASATVGRRVPIGRSTDTPTLPFVLVAQDSDIPHPSMGNTRVTIRVTVWHADPDQARALAVLCQGLLLNHYGPVIRSVWPATGPLAAQDPDSAVDLSSITVLANVRPTNL